MNIVKHKHQHFLLMKQNLIQLNPFDSFKLKFAIRTRIQII